MSCLTVPLVIIISVLLVSQWYILSAYGQCSTNGFTEVSSLSTDGAVTLSNNTITVYLFFSINFTCQVEVSSFTLLAQPNGQLRSYPLIQIWRKNSLEENLYNKVHSVGNGSEVIAINSTHYQYTPTNGSITVQSGDILGLLVPSSVGDAIILPYFIDEGSNAPMYYETTTSTLLLNEIFLNDPIFLNRYSPLVAVEIAPSVSLSDSSTSVTSSSVTASSTIISLTTTIAPSITQMTTSIIPMTSNIPVTSSIPVTSTPVTSNIPMTSNTPVTSSVLITDIPIISSTVVTTTNSVLITTNTVLITTNTVLTSSILMFNTSSIVVLPSPDITSTLNSEPILTTLPSLTPSSSLVTDTMISSSPSPTPPLGDPSSPISAAVIGGLSVAGVLILVIIGLVFILVLLFGVGKKRGKKRSFSPPPVEPEPLDNPNYSAVVDGVPPSMTSTLTGDRFVTHYEIPGYQDPLGSPIIDENHYDQATNGIGITAFYDEARREGEDAAIYHDTGEWSHYEMDDQQLPQTHHYEMNSDFVYDSATPSGYEEPVSSRSNTMKGGAHSTLASNHYDVIPDMLKLSSNPLHQYSVITTKDIFVPTEEERLEMSHPQTQTIDSERMYSHLEVRQRQKYENVKFFEETDIYWSPATEKTVLYEQLARRKYREIRQSQLRITRHLGSGQFGTVNEGVWQSPNGLMSVAIKMLAENSNEEQKVKLLQEAAIMGQFCHPNVIRLHGVVTVGEPVMIVMDLMKNGDLRNHLHLVRSKLGQNVANDSLLPQKLLEFCKQIAKGMNYLSKKSFVHRDLAARNVFLDTDYICKIGDFGMSRDLEDENYYISHGGQIPIKWTAPEALQYKRYAPPSDVWSYGAVLYEIWSLGHKPFEGFSNPQAVDMVQSGYRLPPPPGCPRAIYQMMIHCWHPDSSRRPNFADILQSLSEERLLSWRDLDRSIHPQASELGAALEAGQDLYPELQQTFIKSTLKH